MGTECAIRDALMVAYLRSQGELDSSRQAYGTEHFPACGRFAARGNGSKARRNPTQRIVRPLPGARLLAAMDLRQTIHQLEFQKRGQLSL